MNEAQEIRKEINRIQSLIDNQTFTIKELMFNRRTNKTLLKLLNKKLNGATVKLREVCPFCKSTNTYPYEPVGICWDCGKTWTRE